MLMTEMETPKVELAVRFYPARAFEQTLKDNDAPSDWFWLTLNDYDPKLAALEIVNYFGETYEATPEQLKDLFKFSHGKFVTHLTSLSLAKHESDLVFAALSCGISIRQIYSLSTPGLRKMVEFLQTDHTEVQSEPVDIYVV